MSSTQLQISLLLYLESFKNKKFQKKIVKWGEVSTLHFLSQKKQPQCTFDIIYKYQFSEMQENNFFPIIFVSPEGVYYQQMVYWPKQKTPAPVEKPTLENKVQEDANQNTQSSGSLISLPPKPIITNLKANGKPIAKNQNPQRNVLTNISSQLFTYLLNKRKSVRILNFIKPDRTDDWETNFYSFVKRVRAKFSGYYNFKKMKLMWFDQADDEGSVEEYQILRIMSQYYIRHKLISSLLTSKKMSTELKTAHLKARRILMRLLRDPNTPELPCWPRVTQCSN